MTKNKKAPRLTVARKKKVKKSEVGLLGQALRRLGGIGGAFAGNLIGQSDLGARHGTSLGASISRWLGAGDYTVASNSIVQRSLSGSAAIPMMHKSGQSLTIRHKEFIGEIKGSIAFTVQRFFILQPGDSNTFPWLNSIAAQFQQYRIKGMVFHYVPTSGDAVSSTNPAIGSVMMQTSYRSSDIVPVNKVEMLNEYWASESKPSEDFCHPIECSPKENPFSVHYVRNAPPPTGDSPLMYDIGTTYVATQGMQGANPVGDLWVTYEIELLKPQVASNVTPSVLSRFYRNTTVTSTDYFGLGDQLLQGNLGATFNGRTVSFTRGMLGVYYVTVNWIASTTFSAFSVPGSVTYSNCTFASVDTNPPGFSFYSTTVAGATATTTMGSYFIGVTITDPNASATITLPVSAITGTVAAVEAAVLRAA